jgi:hypothetical protein
MVKERSKANMDTQEWEYVELLEAELAEIKHILQGGIKGPSFLILHWRERIKRERLLNLNKALLEEELYHARLLRDFADPEVCSLSSGTRWPLLEPPAEYYNDIEWL